VAELICGVPAPSSGKDPSSELYGWTMTFPKAFVAIPLGAVPNTTDLPSVPTYFIYMGLPSHILLHINIHVSALRCQKLLC
jgi:hypothetical protein